MEQYTLRDRFAIAYLKANADNDPDVNEQGAYDFSRLAREAYAVADAMLKAREE